MFRRKLSKEGRFEASKVARHLAQHLGESARVTHEEVAQGVVVAVHEFTDVPFAGQVTLVTEGLSTYFRSLDVGSGIAQELMLVVDASFFNEEMYAFFLATVTVYAQEGELLDWDEPIRLSSGVPGGHRTRFLLPMPAALFDDEFPMVETAHGDIILTMLVPIFENEVEYLRQNGSDALYDKLGEQDADVSDLTRPALVLP